MKKTILTMAVITTMFVACKSSKPADTTSTKPTETTKPKMDCGSPEPTYANDIKLIIATNCINCHGEGGRGGYNFGDVNDVKRAGANGDLVGVVKWSPGFKKMPARGAKLDDATIAKIECWVKGGMKI
jgi:cytochrome c5